MFMHCVGSEVLTVPSTYFKLDPEHNQPGARVEDLTAHFDGWFANHPAAERFPLFRVVVALEVVDMMMVRVARVFGTCSMRDHRSGR
jgi:hypothetical protein